MPNHVHGIAILKSDSVDHVVDHVGAGFKPAPTELRNYGTTRPPRNRKGVQDIFR